MLRDELGPLTTARIVTTVPLRLNDEPEFLGRPELEAIGREYANPLAITGTIAFEYPARTRQATRPGRHTDVHTLVTLRIRLAFIEARTGRVLATKTYPRREVDVGHGGPKLLEAFHRLFGPLRSSILQDVLHGPGGPQWRVE